MPFVKPPIQAPILNRFADVSGLDVFGDGCFEKLLRVIHDKTIAPLLFFNPSFLLAA
jgi:hypothetical protein